MVPVFLATTQFEMSCAKQVRFHLTLLLFAMVQSLRVPLRIRSLWWQAAWFAHRNDLGFSRSSQGRTCT
jgi:hypothetical protein